MSEIRISNLIIPKYRPLFNNRQYKHIILTSGRAGTKSSFAAIRGDYQLVAGEKSSVVVLRKHHNKLRKTVYKEMLRGISRLQIPKKKFRITKSPMEITYLKNGNTMYFAGSDGIDDTKGIIDEERPIKLVIIDEATEFFDDGEGEDEILNIEATFARGNNGGFQMIYLYNPPKNPNAPINEWVKKMEKRPDCIHIHTDYRDVPEEWIGKDLIETAEALKAVDEKQYNWIWLGQCVGIEEIIYYMFKQDMIVQPQRAAYPIAIGIDYGQMNATTYQAFGLDKSKKKFRGLNEYYYSGRDTGKQKSPSEYAEDFKEFFENLQEMYGIRTAYVFIDPSAKGLAEEIRRKCPVIKIVDAQNDVQLGIARTQKLMSYGILEVSPEQENLIHEAGIYEYDKKSIEAGKEVPVKTNDHCMDAMRYAVMGMWKYVRYFLPKAEQED